MSVVSPGFAAVPEWARVMAEGSGGRFVLRQATIGGVRGMSADELRRKVAGSYWNVLHLAKLAGCPHPVRVWNVVPGITEDLESGDRYMAFNAGRFDTYSKVFKDFPENLPAASGVGCLEGDSLDIHVLSSTLPGAAVENPRQVSAYRYSERYGKLPPCFSRAMRWEDGNGDACVFVSGTAAIVGEDTALEGNLAGQLGVTVGNLRGVVARAGEGFKFRQLRAYVPGSEHGEWVRGELLREFRGARVEVVRAELCRRNLLVEVEGLALNGG